MAHIAKFRPTYPIHPNPRPRIETSSRADQERPRRLPSTHGAYSSTSYPQLPSTGTRSDRHAIECTPLYTDDSPEDEDGLKDGSSYSPTISEVDALEEAFSLYEKNSKSTDDKFLIAAINGDIRKAKNIIDDASNNSTFTTRPSQPLESTQSTPRSGKGTRDHSSLEDCLKHFWPQLPLGLDHAPFPIIWEIMRIALHCSVNIEEVELPYNEDWKHQDRLWEDIKAHPAFNGKTLPSKSDAQAWYDSIHNNFRDGERSISLKASMSLSGSSTGPFMELELQPLKHEQGCRLFRRFGPDRFLELTLPSISAWPKKSRGDEDTEIIASRWLTREPHSFLGRQWAAFWVKDGRKKSSLQESSPGMQSRPQILETIRLFAEAGRDFAKLGPIDARPPRAKNSIVRPYLTRAQMLDWLLNFEDNGSESYLKLFTRISLGLSKTTPFVLQENQIHHRENDLRYLATGDVMNDGIGRISPSLMKKLPNVLGGREIPCAVQGRIGSAKGMWITDVTDTSNEDWIETHPKQRKWECKWSDEYHHTLEIRSFSSKLKPANLNTQFLPVLEDRAIDKRAMRQTISDRISDEISKEMEYIKSALKHPELLRKWVFENSMHPPDRPCHDAIPFLGGLPAFDDDIINFLLDGGFDPLKQKYLLDRVVKRQRQKYEKLESEMKIKIGRSAYAYMVVDFLGVLEPNEIHLGFSSRFEDGVEDPLDLHGFDVLVGRCPAHFPSDIQKVKAVFKPELRHLQDVVIFSSKGDKPLADKLSGGDYDGDTAWVCWDPDIVNNFRSAKVPFKPNLSPYFKRDKTTVGELLKRHGKDKFIDVMIEQAFRFSLKQDFLGICTAYKEKFCHDRNCISDRPALALSSLLGDIADQAKQGIIFGQKDWDAFQRDMLSKGHYKSSPKKQIQQPDHILDFLRTRINAVICDELNAFNGFIREGPVKAYLYDADLAGYWDRFQTDFEGGAENEGRHTRWVSTLKSRLRADIWDCAEFWSTSGTKASYQDKVWPPYERWRSISPCIEEGHQHDTIRSFLLQQGNFPPELSQWELLKASLAFTMSQRPKSDVPLSFVWQIVGRQLQYIKAQSTGLDKTAETRRGIPILMASNMYAALKPDGRYIRRLMSEEEGQSSAA
ncbi:hypothetical protein M426DRAFT_268321 [Hypoxylon sp. CI-4A]|nr:hypothetical protein M426DRAFT_268321 [Hypoxylon sp. CI-4A]